MARRSTPAASSPASTDTAPAPAGPETSPTAAPASDTDMVGALDGAPAAPPADTAPDAAATPATPTTPPVDPEKEIAAEIAAAQARLAELGDPNAIAKAASDLLAKANQELLDKSRDLELAVYRARDHMRTTREKVQMDLEEKRLLLIRIGHLEAEAESIKAAKAAAAAIASAEGDA